MVRNNKDEINGHSSKKKPDIRKDSSLRTFGKAKASDVRRLAREASESRQKTPSPQRQRKSQRLEKGTPPLTPNMKQISDRLGKNNTPSPVRRSDRGKKILSPSSSGLRKSAKELSLPEWKRNKEKKLIMRMESEKAEVDLEAVGMKRKTLNARSYLDLFKRQRVVVPDGDGGLEGRDKLLDVCGDNSVGIGSEPLRNGDGSSDECSRRMVGERDEHIDIDKASNGACLKSDCSKKDCDEDLKNNGIMDCSSRDNVLDKPCSKYSDTSSSVRETLDCPEGLLTNCSSTENIDTPELDSSTCLANTGDGPLCSDINENCVPSEEDAPSTSPKCENCDLLGSCVLCSKNKRVGYSAPEQELCSCSFTVDEHLGSFSTCKEDVTATVLRLLEYVIKNRDVNSDSQSVVQSLQISLCWIAASIKKIKIDKKDSLLLAKQLLNYQCTDEQAHSVYLILKEMYSQCQEKIVHTSNIRMVAEEGNEQAAASDSDASIKKLQKRTRKWMKRLKKRHHEKLQEVHKKWDKERIKLETDHKLESAFIRSVHGQGSVGMDKLKLLDNELAVKMEELNFKKDMALKDLEAKQLADMDEQRKAAQWLTVAEANSSGSAAVNGPQSLGPQPEEHVVEGPQPSALPDEVTVNLQNEVGVSSSAVIENVNQIKHPSDNGETVLASPVEEINASKIMPDKECESASSDAVVSQDCGTNEAASGDSQHPRQQPLLHSERTKALSDCSDLSSLQVQQVKTDQSLAPVGLQHLDQPALGNQSTLQTGTELINTVNPGPVNHEAPVTNKTATPILLTHETPVTDETTNPVPSNHEAPEIENSECNKSSVIEENDQGRSSAHQTAQRGGTEVLPNESVPQSGETSYIHNNHINTGPVAQNDVTTSHVVARISGRPNHAVLQLGNDASGSSHPYSSADPLQNELDNLKRESEQLEKYHKDLESKLKSDCDKEIQEIVTQIRNKYEAKSKENEAEFRLKKNELEKNQVKVLMNKILAAAFRFKCSNPRPALVPSEEEGTQPCPYPSVERLLPISLTPCMS
ncbi:hypothetical protein OROGR_002589 [Orobanche gracilis]